MQQRYFFLFASLSTLLSLSLLSARVHTQGRGSVVGQVTDANSGQPLPGANGVVDGTTACGKPWSGLCRAHLAPPDPLLAAIVGFGRSYTTALLHNADLILLPAPVRAA